jgi:UDP-glucose 4-epimerase
MRKATGFDFKYEIISRRAGDVPDLTADPTLARKELGFSAPVRNPFLILYGCIVIILC